MQEKILIKFDNLRYKRENQGFRLNANDNEKLREYEDDLNYIEQVIESKKK
jgi:hypothetical protein